MTHQIEETDRLVCDHVLSYIIPAKDSLTVRQYNNAIDALYKLILYGENKVKL